VQNPSSSARELAELVKLQIPTCNCSASSIAWYKNKLKKGEIKGFSPSDNPAAFTVSREKANASRWPEWNLPSDDELLQLAKITIPYICFLHPEIVAFMVADNQLHREEWHAGLAEYGVDPSLYLWDGSPCAFPGVRRYAGSAEIAQHRKKLRRWRGPIMPLHSTTTAIRNKFGALYFLASASLTTDLPVILLLILLTTKIIKTERETRSQIIAAMKSPSSRFLDYILVLQIQCICRTA